MQWMQGYPFYLLVGCLLSYYLTLLSYKHRRTPGKRFFWICGLLVGTLLLTTALELMAHSFGQKLWWRNIQQIPLFFAGLFFYALAVDYVGKYTYRTRQTLSVLVVPVLAYLVLIFTDGVTHLMRIQPLGLDTVSGLSEVSVHPTLLSMAFIAYENVLCLLAVFILMVNLRNTPTHNRKQHLLLLTGTLIPVVLVLLLPILHIKILGYTALSFLPALLLIYYALFRYELLSVWPMAKDKVFEAMKEGIVLIDKNDVIVDINGAATRILPQISPISSKKMLIGQNILVLMAPLTDFVQKYETGCDSITEVDDFEKGERNYRISITPVDVQTGHRGGTLLILNDITELKSYEEQLIRQATIDDLTGVLNRKHFLATVRSSLSKGGITPSLLLLDIDNFKSVNDTYGHIAGDQALVEFCSVLKKTAGLSGTIGRMGGEEFAIYFSDLDEGATVTMAEYLRREIGEAPIPVTAKCQIVLTVSLGIAHSDTSSITFEQLYHQADRGLYASKGGGKNRTAYVKNDV